MFYGEYEMNIKIGDYVETMFQSGIVYEIIQDNILMLVDAYTHTRLNCVETYMVINHVPKPDNVNYMFLLRIKRDHDRLSKGESL